MEEEEEEEDESERGGENEGVKVSRKLWRECEKKRERKSAAHRLGKEWKDPFESRSPERFAAFLRSTRNPRFSSFPTLFIIVRHDFTDRQFTFLTSLRSPVSQSFPRGKKKVSLGFYFFSNYLRQTRKENISMSKRSEQLTHTPIQSCKIKIHIVGKLYPPRFRESNVIFVIKTVFLDMSDIESISMMQ